MGDFSVIALFCEDIREEVGGLETVVGIMPDNILIPTIPSAFTKLAIYVRMLFPLDWSPKAIQFLLKHPDNVEQEIGKLSADDVAASLANTQKDASYGVGLILRVRMQNLQINQAGKFVAIVRIADEEKVCGSLKITAQTLN